jgi:hypothetical protein
MRDFRLLLLLFLIVFVDSFFDIRLEEVELSEVVRDRSGNGCCCNGTMLHRGIGLEFWRETNGRNDFEIRITSRVYSAKGVQLFIPGAQVEVGRVTSELYSRPCLVRRRQRTHTE